MSRRIVPVLCIAMLATTLRCAKDLDLAPVPGKGGALTGRLVSREALTGNVVPAPGATLEFLRGGPHAVADQEGRFAVRPPPAPWQLLIRDGCSADRSICARQKMIASGEVPFDPDLDYSLGDVVVADNGAIRGTVRLSDRQAGFGGVVAYVPGAPFRAVSGDDGTFVIQNVPEGTMSVGFFLAGYEPVTRTGVPVTPSSSIELAEVELLVTPPANLTASIHGHVTRADGAPGDVHIEALRQGDAAAAGVLDVRADEDFVLQPLPLGLYEVIVEAEGYGRTVLHNLLLHQDVSLDLNVGTVVVPNTFESTGGGGSGGGGAGGSGGSGGGGGTGGSGPPPTCADDPGIRGPCFLDWSPPTDDVLPAMGTVVLHVDKPLQGDTVSVLFRSSLGAVVQGVSTYVPPALGLATGGAGGGGSGDTYGRIEFRPSRPLSPGTWTALLSPEVRDVNGLPAPQVGPTWLVTGVEAGPAVSGGSRLDTGAYYYGVYPSLGANNLGQTWLAFGQPGATGAGTDYFASLLDPGQVPYAYTLFSAPRWYYEVPLRVSSSDAGEAFLVDFPACRTGGYAPRVARAAYSSPVFGKPLPDCSTTFGVSRSDPLTVVGWQDALARFVVTTGDELALSSTYGNPFEANTHYDSPLDLFDVPAAEGPLGPLGPSRRLLAAVRTDPLSSRTLDVMELGQDGGLTTLPGVVLSGISEGLTGTVIGCGAGGLPLVVFTTMGAREQNVARAAAHDGVKWIPIPMPSDGAGLRPVRCVTRGETPILFWLDGSNLQAAYLVLDRAAPERSRWVQIRDRRQATGALNVSDTSCYVNEVDAMLDPAGRGLLFAYHQYCSTTQTIYGELRFGRLY